MEFDAWAKTPIPDEIEKPRKDWREINADPPFSHLITEDQLGQHRFHDIWRDPRQEPVQRPVDPTKRFEQIRWHRALFGVTSVLDYDDDLPEWLYAVLIASGPAPGFIGPFEYIKPDEKEIRRKTRWTEDEYAAKDKHYAGYWGKLHSFLFVAKEGMEGWGDGDELDPIDSDQAEFMVATLFRNHALKGELYRLPKKVLQQRWKMGCKREGKTIPYKFNQGLGLFNKYGRRLLDYDVGFSILLAAGLY